MSKNSTMQIVHMQRKEIKRILFSWKTNTLINILIMSKINHLNIPKTTSSKI